MIGRVPLGQALGAILVALLVAVSGWTDVDRYFDKQMHDASVFAEYSARATFIGREAAALPAGTRVIVDERQLNEPSIKFLAPNLAKPEGYKPVTLPLSVDADTVLFLSGDQAADAEYAQRLYPGATLQRFSPPYGGPVLLNEVRIGRAQVEAIQGLTASYQAAGGQPLSASVGSLDGPLPGAPAGRFVANLNGAIQAPAYGDYGFRVEAPGSTAELLVDRETVVAGTAAVRVTLARGMHHLGLKVAADDPSAAVRLLWRPPGASTFAPVPRQSLFVPPATENGLLGRFYPNSSWTGPAAIEEIDPFIGVYYQVTPLPLPFSVDWTGQLAAPVSGVYRFNSTSIDSSQVSIDGRPTPGDGPLTLSAGLHDIELRYEAHSGHNHVELRWQPPGRDWEIVPSQFLFPSGGTAAAQPLPDLPAVVSDAAQNRLAGPLTTLQSAWRTDLGPESVPAGVALDRAGNVYVADAGRHTLLELDANGNVLWPARPPRVAGLEQLAAVAVAQDGSVLALDGDSGTISRFSPSGQYAGVVAKDLAVYHPRGLTVAANGDIYVADTGGSHILHLTADGRPVGQIGVRGKERGALDQPSGIAVAGDGSAIVVDPSSHKMVRFTASGGVAAEWPFVDGPTVNGPQLAAGAGDVLWATDTNGGVIEEFSLDGQPRGRFAPAGGLAGPSGIAVADGYIVVAEPEANRVQKLLVGI